MRSIFFRTKTKGLYLLIALLHFFLAAGCSSIQPSVSPPLSMPDDFSHPGKTPLPQKWWFAFQDENLNILIDQGLAENFTLQSAWNRLEQARAVARQKGAARFPTLDGKAGVSRTTTKNSGSSTENTSIYSLGAMAGYEVDLWGRIRSGWQASQSDVLAAQEDLHAAAITLSAEIAATWYRLIEQRLQIQLLDEQIGINEKYLDLITHQFSSGQAPATDVLQQRQQLEASRGDKISALANEKILEHQLAILTGQSPRNATIPHTDPLAALPALPATGLPAALLQRRPDILQSYYRVQAADQRVAAAIADRFPQISLSASVETNAGTIRDLFDNWLASLAGNLLAPLFDAGTKRAEVDRTKAVAQEALNNYGQKILLAIGEVEDALVAEAQQDKLLDSLDRQLSLSQQSSVQTKERYLNGDMEFLRFLTTQLNHQTLQRSQLSAKRQLIEYRIDLCRALAGSWPMERRQQPDRFEAPGNKEQQL